MIIHINDIPIKLEYFHSQRGSKLGGMAMELVEQGKLFALVSSEDSCYKIYDVKNLASIVA